ncbi:LacI family transcriptional regulator [Oceanobacillus oncorhynchi subsp. incaldanensis]|uniref:LacI family DNA-binding transcriptional regulator n=1 Tax=Oceanobacillus oncorhynchi TaxID=545501 RepID=UPI001B13330F|nr:LacI family DNA-binding transcriptional regulator [Oceanobacillus oncorhynchi]GIO20259.1 LacI family transcriptional regulator [Oceanobacillus oncorhynchi subsp. incaldanensis]
MATIREIAKQANVSIGTASFVLNGKAEQMRISKKTQQKVLETAKKLGYNPSLSARRLRTKGEKEVPVIAILWTLDTRTSLISRFMQGIQTKSLYQDGLFELVIQPYENDKLNEVKSLHTGLRFNGAIVANASDKDMAYLEKADLSVPVVVYQRHSNKYGTVCVDSENTGKELASLFISNGHRHVGMVIPNVSSEAIELRRKGFKERWNRESEVSNIQEWFGEFSEKGGYEAALHLLRYHNEMPTALFFLSDHMAMGALAAFHQKNIRIPEDIEIIGHDNISSTQFTFPSLSTVHLPVEEMAEACVRQLLKIINHEVDTSESINFESYLVERNSSLDRL